MSLKNKKLILAGLAVLSMSLVPFFASADGGYLCTPSQGDASTTDAYRCLINIRNASYVVAAIAAVIMISVAGYLYVFAAGNEGNISKAKGLIYSAVSGLVIMLIGGLILAQINPDLLNFRSISPQQIAGREWVLPDGTIYNGDKPPADATPIGAKPSGNAQSLAQQILSNSKITLATTHVSGVKDNANAKQNVVDTAAGKLAARSCYAQAPCGYVALTDSMLAGMLQMATKYSFSVSEIAGGGHSGNSRHYTGSSFDANVINGSGVTNNALAAQFAADCRAAGATEVIAPPADGHETHVHCAWPRGSVGQVNQGGGTTTGPSGSWPTGSVTGKGGAVCNGGTANRANEPTNCSAYASEIAAAARATGLSAAQIRAIMHIESQFNSGAANGGLMQVTTQTAAQFCSGLNWQTNTADNIMCGARVFKDYQSRTGSIENSIAAYNGGLGANDSSRDCPGLARWQCAFDNPEQTTCNTGFSVSRNYVLNYKSLLPKYQSACPN